MKIKTKLMLGVIPCLSTSIVASLASCSNETPNEKEIKKCNYTVKSFQEINNNDIDFYIGPEIKGYVSGKWYIDNFTESFTCEIVSNVDFVGANIYIPKWIDVNGVVYTIIGIGGNSLGNLQAKIVFPDSVIKISKNSFSGCSKLTSVILPDSILSISGFSNCTGLTSIQLPKKLTVIGYNAFSGCTNLTSISIPETTEKILSSAFVGCSSLETISLPNNLIEIGYEAFRGCTNITSLIIPEKIKIIEDASFAGCSKLKSISLPKNLEEIQTEAFYDCVSLEGITLPANLLEIQGSAFEGCSKLTSSITLPKNMSLLGYYAFGYTNITSINIPNEIQLQNDAFRQCKKISVIIFDGFDNQPSWDQGMHAFREIKYSSGIVKSINGSWTASDALSFAKDRGLPSDWHN